MTLPKLGCIFLLATVLVVGCRSKESRPSATASASDFVGAFRQAHDRDDFEALSRLVCWDRVPPEMKKLSEDSLKAFFDDKVVDIKFTTEHPEGRPDTYVRNGVTYRFNLPVVAEVVVQNPSLAKEAFSGSYYPLAVKDGRYCIAQMAPVESGELQQPQTPSTLAQQAIPPSQVSAAQPAVVPAKTVLLVRLGEDVGLKTIKAGGNFSATVAKAVVVNGAAVIPEGSIVQGVVAKKGDYSPDATLTSLTMNGASHKISTSYVTFNEEVVFPAGSQMKFELLFPLKLNQ